MSQINSRKIIVAIDGYSSCGKSTTAKAVAQRTGYTYIDTGAMYRAVTLYFVQHYIELTNPRAVAQALSDIHVGFQLNPRTGNSDTCLNNVNVEEEIRKMYVSDMVSEVSALVEVRNAMVAQQQKMGRKKGVVMDGRDIGTRVFPDAELKIFMNADMQVRAQRRQEELLAKKQLVSLEDVIKNIEHRDLLDTTRKESPLIKAPDAHLLDTTFLSIEEQVDAVIALMVERITELELAARKPAEAPQ